MAPNASFIAAVVAAACSDAAALPLDLRQENIPRPFVSPFGVAQGRRNDNAGTRGAAGRRKAQKEKQGVALKARRYGLNLRQSS
jgi:hypothetical protein